MDWYYSDGKTQFGPVNEVEFERLQREGIVHAQSLVWNQTMPNWLPWGQVNAAVAPAGASGFGGIGSSPTPSWGAPAGQQSCSVCGRYFPEGDLMRYESSLICAECKPVYFQRLREGASSATHMDFAGFWTRFAAYLIDAVITQIINVAVLFVFGGVLGDAVDSASTPSGIMMGFFSLATLVPMAFVATYHVFFLGKFGATPGKMAMRIKVVRADGSPISYGLAFGRYLAYIPSSILLLAGFIMAAFDDEKRALHDRICGTRVIRTN